MAQFSGRTVSAGDAGMLVSGVVVAVSSFLPWYGWRAGDNYHLQYTAWDNLLPLIAVVLIAVASVLAATRMFDGVRLRAIGPVGPSFLLVLLPAAAVVLMVVGWLTVGEATDPLLRSVLQGEARYGLFVGLGAALVQLVFAALAFQASGEGFAGRGRASAPQPVPYGQPYGQQPTPGYWPYDQYAHANAPAAPSQSVPYGSPPAPYPQPGSAPVPLPPPAFAPIDGPSPYARPSAAPPAPGAAADETEDVAAAPAAVADAPADTLADTLAVPVAGTSSEVAPGETRTSS